MVQKSIEGVKGTNRLRRYWSHGAGAAKIRWGTPGDLTRCHRHLSKYMPGRAWGYCQMRHKQTLGTWNPESGGRGKKGGALKKAAKAIK